MKKIIIRTKPITDLKSKLILNYNDMSLENIIKAKGINCVLQDIFE